VELAHFSELFLDTRFYSESEIKQVIAKAAAEMTNSTGVIRPDPLQRLNPLVLPLFGVPLFIVYHVKNLFASSKDDEQELNEERLSLVEENSIMFAVLNFMTVKISHHSIFFLDLLNL